MRDAPDQPGSAAGNLTQLLGRIDAGDARAADRLLPLVYGELRTLAAAKMAREPAGLTLQPTALVHEAWLRLGGSAQPDWRNRAHFFAAAAEAMRRILIDHARRRHRQRHGGGLQKVSASETGFDLAGNQMDDRQLLRLDAALEELQACEPRQAELVKRCYFVGLSLKEAAASLDISERTAVRDWNAARVWLFAHMTKADA